MNGKMFRSDPNNRFSPLTDFGREWIHRDSRVISVGRARKGFLHAGHERGEVYSRLARENAPLFSKFKKNLQKIA